MGEAKIRSLQAVEGRAALKTAGDRRSRIKDRFGRAIEIGDAVLLGSADPYNTLWRIMQVTPAIGVPNIPPGAVFVDMQSVTRVLFAPGMPSENVTLVLPGKPAEETAVAESSETAEEAGNAPPGETRTASGLFVPPQDK